LLKGFCGNTIDFSRAVDVFTVAD
jgi:hypothetical protein